MAQPVGTELAAGPLADAGAPGTPHEEAILALWRDVLERPGIGVHDDFFDLDGNSLQAIKVIARIRELYGVSVRATDFFDSPTVAALAAFIASQAPSDRAVIRPRPPDAEPVLSFDQQRLWLVNQIVPEAAYNVHGRRRLLGPLDVPVLEASIREIQNRHEALRTRFPDLDGEPLQVVDDLPADWRLPVAEVSPGTDAERLAEAVRLLDADAMTSLDLVHGPLFRALLVKVADGDHVLGITAHHTVCDNGSVALFIQELSALYRAGGDPEKAELPELPIQYRDFAVWQHEWLASDTVEEQLDYWVRHLAGAPAELTLPGSAHHQADQADGAADEKGGRVRSSLSVTDTAALHVLCRDHDVTVFMVLLAAFTAVLARWSGQRDVVVGVPITGRTDAGVRRLIGLFFNTLPIRMDLRGDPAFADLLVRARETALGGYGHAEVPLDLIVRRARPVRIQGRTPLFQVVLNVVDDTRGATGLGDVDDEPMDSPVMPSKLDFVISARELDGSQQWELEFDAARYDEPQMHALLDEVAALLRTAIDNPGTAVFGQGGTSPAPEETPA